VVRSKESGQQEQGRKPHLTACSPQTSYRKSANGRQVIGYLRVSHPWFEVTKPIQQLVFDLPRYGIDAVSVAMSGWFLSGKQWSQCESYHRLKQFTADASHELRVRLL